jgi:hypothetical protein
VQLDERHQYCDWQQSAKLFFRQQNAASAVQAGQLEGVVQQEEKGPKEADSLGLAYLAGAASTDAALNRLVTPAFGTG